MLHKDLESQRYLINERKADSNGYEGREVELDLPVYELFDPPN